MKKKRFFFVFCLIFLIAIILIFILKNNSFHNGNDYIVIGEGSHAFINGEKYIPCGISFSESGKAFKKIDGFTVFSIPEDKDRNFVVIKSFLDHWTFVKESYNIPKEGELTVAYMAYDRITKGEKWNMMKSIQAEEFQGSFTVKTENSADIFNATKPIYFGYNDCPVGTDRMGCVGIINEKLVFIKSKEIHSETLEYICYILKDEYKNLYNSYLVHRTFEIIE